MHKIIAIAFVLISVCGYGQLTTEADFKRQVYDNEMTGGIMLHTRGFGINLRRMKFRDGFNKWGWEIDLASIRHPKEVKLRSQLFFNSNRSFVYGKLNGLYTIRLGYGRDKILVDKTDQGSVSISWVTIGGPSFGILKPIYLEVVKEDQGGQDFISTERYDPEIHDYVDIFGQAPFFTGIEKSNLRLGLYVKTGFAFDFHLSDKKITTIEVGGIADLFPSYGIYQDEKVPIMYEVENYNLWLQFYITFNFGGKWN
ncbi:MAG: hypothetical protein N4A46_05120 [Schleiferiaceae bacterium]|jgi:hypothetical protein|nr:hypothetical protein [Schleiferiaceae bacterium]